MIQIERGNVNEAIDAFLRGLQSPVRTAEQEMVLSYEIGSAYEVKKQNKDALTYYQRVARRDPTYRDVHDRIKRLQAAKEKPQAIRAAAVGDEEFDRAFDELIGGGLK
jgi:hypothetical protein